MKAQFGALFDTVVTLLPLGLLGAALAATHLMMAPADDPKPPRLPGTHRRHSQPARKAAAQPHDEPVEV
jgi:hypothetical protein